MRINILFFCLFCFLILVECPAQEYFNPAFSETWSFYAPSDSNPEVIFVVWGFFNTPEKGNRQKVVVELKEESVFKPGFSGVKLYKCSFAGLSFLPDFRLLWVKDPTAAKERKRMLHPNCKVGATAKFKFRKNGKTYSTEVVITFTGRNSLDSFADYAHQALNGLHFTLTQKELTTRRVLNRENESYIITTEWLVDGQPVYKYEQK
jgi:hypothetical protein